MLLREIKKAKHFIHFQVMLLYSDDAGFKVANALAEKAKEGVEVRVMSDSDMSSIVEGLEKIRSFGTSDFDKLKALLSEAGVKFVPSSKESYYWFRWDNIRAELKEKGVPDEFLELQDKVQKGVVLNSNVLDHRKIIIFDGEAAIVSSMNVGNKYMYEEVPGIEEHTTGKHWHDGAVLIKGPCASLLNKHFASKWMVRGGDVFDYTRHYRTKESYGSDACTVYSSFPDGKENHIRNYYLQKIKACKGRFIIENPYINDELFWKELSALDPEQAQKIVIINPYKAKGNDYLQNESSIKCNMRKPFERGVSFFAYKKRMSHWKIALDEAEQAVFYGSYNLNHRSAMHDFELNVLIESEQFCKQVKRLLEQDMADSTQITDAEEFYENPVIHPSCMLLKATEYYE
ncbi:phospholipase D-like domain-containing protein [Nafulsella turpanensis]|uniref:phospholipase D-like domain-containing protein n=1 Tax=Nafulsella turpanensis TaxID=1265690 RepID=UPI00034B0D51|nr:phosphatidylserine/phosphatidylglycerophosphate/cardiolipin synthase family protein [Nafulsella turpanensis]